MELTASGKALIVTLLFRLFFGGYLIGMDQYRFNDVESALTVSVIYILLGVFAALFLMGNRRGIIALMGLEGAVIVLNSAFIVASLSGLTDAGPHNPLENWLATLLRYIFSLLTLIFSIRVYRDQHTSLCATRQISGIA